MNTMDITRRSVLEGGVVLATASLPNAPTRPRVTIGANLATIDALRRHVPLARGVRVFYDKVDDFPATWPVPFPEAWVTMSIRPTPARLFAGEFDHVLHHLAKTAPPHSELTAWHEAGPANPRHYPLSVNNPRTIRGVQHYLRDLLWNTPVGVGSIICGPADQLSDWIGRRLDWYGDDWYWNSYFDNPDGSLNLARMRVRHVNSVAAWRALAGQRHPLVRYCETNCHSARRQARWFENQAQLLAETGGGRLLTFWWDGRSRQGTSGAPWPPRPNVLKALRLMSETYR